MSDKYKDNLIGGVIGAVLAVLVMLLLPLLTPVAVIEEPEERAVRERISIDAREDVYLYNAADFYVYSDFDHAVQKFHVDGATGLITTAAGIEHDSASATQNGNVYTSSNTFQYTDTSAKLMFTIPGNANVVDANLVVTTAFAADPQTTEHADCGTTYATPNEYYNNETASATTVVSLATVAAFGDVGSSDIQVYCLSNTTAGTAGSAVLLVEWVTD